MITILLIIIIIILLAAFFPELFANLLVMGFFGTIIAIILCLFIGAIFLLVILAR